MPPGAKKRKALKKKQQQQQQQQEEAIGTNNGDNLRGSQDDRDSDSNLSSPGSQGNEQFGGTKDPSAAMVKKDAAKEISDVTQGVGGPESGGNNNNAIAVERGTDVVEKNVSSQHPCDKEVAPVVDSVSKVVVSEHAETSAKSNLVKEKKSGETKEYPTTGLGKENGKVTATLLESDAGTSRKVESEVPLSSEEKRLLLPGPPPVRTSWFSCCGLFDAMTGSDR